MKSFHGDEKKGRKKVPIYLPLLFQSYYIIIIVLLLFQSLSVLLLGKFSSIYLLSKCIHFFFVHQTELYHDYIQFNICNSCSVTLVTCLMMKFHHVFLSRKSEFLFFFFILINLSVNDS